MRHKRKYLKEIRDHRFIMTASQNGDIEALKILNLIQAVNEAEEVIKINIRRFKPELKMKILNDYKVLKAQRDILIYQYNLQNKRAKIYLDDLKRKNRQEKKADISHTD